MVIRVPCIHMIANRSLNIHTMAYLRQNLTVIMLQGEVIVLIYIGMRSHVVIEKLL